MELKNNKLLYVDMIQSIEQGATILYEDGHALLIKDTYSDIVYATADNRGSARKMVAHVPTSFEILVTHDTYCNDVLEDVRQLRYDRMCSHCAYFSKELMPIDIPNGYMVKRVTREYMEDVIELYGKEMPDLANEEYMGLCMDGGMFGVFEETTLCGFISAHSQGRGSIGMLEVKEEYRGRGFGVLLERVMINKQIKRGAIPYGEIFIENEASLRLQKKVGMEIGTSQTYWYYQ